MEKFTQKNETTYSSLKKKLLNGSVSFEEARDVILKRDQANLARSASLDNLDFLNDPEIIDYVQKNSQITESYHRLLSLTEFHVAQNLIESGDFIGHFESALKNAVEGNSNEAWIAYIEGTILYLKGQNIPTEIIEKTRTSGNDRILENFNFGLAERGHPSYLEDYGK